MPMLHHHAGGFEDSKAAPSREWLFHTLRVVLKSEAQVAKFRVFFPTLQVVWKLMKMRSSVIALFTTLVVLELLFFQEINHPKGGFEFATARWFGNARQISIVPDKGSPPDGGFENRSHQPLKPAWSPPKGGLQIYIAFRCNKWGVHHRVGGLEISAFW